MSSAYQSEASGRWGKIPAHWLDHPEIDADAVAVLAALSTFADRSGRCWPSQTTLAGKLKRSRSWVSKVIARLATTGVLEVRDRWSENGGRLSSVYVLVTGPESPAEPRPDAEDSAVVIRNAPVTATDTPRSPGRQEHRNPEQTLDSRSKRAEATRDGTPYDSRLTEVPEGWTPAAADLAWAGANFATVDPHRHAEGFVLRCRAHGYRYRDVGAAWRSWLMEDVAAGKAAPRIVATPAPLPAAAGFRPARQAAAEERFGAWASVAARLNGSASTSSAAPCSGVRS